MRLHACMQVTLTSKKHHAILPSESISSNNVGKVLAHTIFVWHMITSTAKIPVYISPVRPDDQTTFATDCA